MESFDEEVIRRYILEHTDVAERFPNWSSTFNVSDIFRIFFNGTRMKPHDQQDTAEEQAEYDHLYEVSVQFKRFYLWIILALGLPGNIASLVTFLHMRSLGSCVVYVAILAVVDSLALVEKIALSLMQHHGASFSPESCKALLFLANALVIYANWIIVALAAERLFAVHRPLVLSVFWTRSRAAGGLAVLMLLSFLVCVPVIVVTVPRDDTLSCVYAAEHRHLAQAWNWANVTLYGLLPCVSLLVINVAIISLLRKARRKQLELCQGRGSLSSAKQRLTADSQKQASLILLVASFVLIMLTLPRCVLLLMQHFWRPQGLVAMAKLRIVNQVTYALSDLNHAINFYLYFVSARPFRRRFLDLLRSSPIGSRCLRVSDTDHNRICDSESVRITMVSRRSTCERKNGDWQEVKLTSDSL